MAQLKGALALLLWLGLAQVPGSAGQWFDPHCDGKQVIVHLFEWKWNDIAAECERFLAPMGYCGVQVSPPMEHAVIGEAGFPWYQRYQPVSYILTSRSGTEDEFASMVSRCNNVGVRIYVDAVVNHMTGAERSGTGSAGSSFDGGSLSYPSVPFSGSDFTPRDLCSSASGNIENYSDPNQVRNCKLVNLADLYGGSDYVRGKIAEYFNHCTNLGVAGFRVDAAKHMWPGDIAGIQGKLRSLNPTWFRQGSQPFFYHEVIDYNSEPIKSSEYFDLGRVTEFRYCAKIAAGVKNFGELGNLVDASWNMSPSDKAFVFVDNHDNQRGHGGAGEVITHKDPYNYKLAVAYMLAHPYGFTRVMSSYYFDNPDGGPPSMGGGGTNDVPINDDGSCGGGWVCEHRWPQIANMVRFRNTAAGTDMGNYVNENGVVGFSRGDRGFFAMAQSGSIDRSFQTGLPPGSYCNIIDNCATSTTVGGDGMAYVSVNGGIDPAIFAICVNCEGGGGGWTVDPPTAGPTEAPITTGTKTTVIFIHKQTMAGQDVYLRGGISHDQRPGCTEDAESSACAIDISINSLGSSEHYGKYDAYAVGDTKLDWYGPQAGQGSFQGTPSEGTALAWTSNQQSSPGYQALNHWGEHYWMVSMEMDCSQTEGGWFEVKAYVSNGDGWETDVTQGNCKSLNPFSTSWPEYEETRAPYPSSNHMAMCGYVNLFEWSSATCTIEPL